MTGFTFPEKNDILIAYGYIPQTTATNNFVLCPLDSGTTYDSSCVSYNNNRFIILNDGWYEITIIGRWSDVVAVNNCYLGISVNNETSDTHGVWSDTEQRLTQCINKPLLLSAGTTICGVIYSNLSGNSFHGEIFIKRLTNV